jgi:hypothetical protein
VAQFAQSEPQSEGGWPQMAQSGGQTADGEGISGSTGDDLPSPGPGMSEAAGRGASSSTPAHGGFFVPAPTPAGGGTAAPKRGGDLEGLVRRMKDMLSADKRDTIDAQARYFTEHFVDALNQSKEVVKQEYRHEYGSAMFGGHGCHCFCGKCHMSQDLPFTQMRAYLYAPVGGDVEVILTCSAEQASQLEKSGAKPAHWTAFSRSHTAEQIAQKCPPVESDDESGDGGDTSPEWDSDLTLPTAHDFARNGLPHFNTMKRTGGWTIQSLQDLFEIPMKYKGLVYPPASMWPLTGQVRAALYRRHACKGGNLPSFGDTNLKNAAKLYWWVCHDESGFKQEEPGHKLNMTAEDARAKAYYPTNPAWLDLARATAVERGVKYDMATYEACTQ